MGTPLNVAVCGGSGRVGRAVVRELLARGHSVVNLDRQACPDSAARFVCVDLARREQIQPVFEKADAVIQLAEVYPGNVALAAEDVYAHNTRVSAVVMQTAADVGVGRLIYTSSCQVYGCWDEPHVPPRWLPFDETHPVQPQNINALGKVANENYARWLGEQAKISIAIFRLPWVMNAEPSDSWWRWLESQTGRIDGLGTYVHQGDAACAYALAVEHPRAGCEAYHFCADEIASVVSLRDRLKSMAGYPVISPEWAGMRSPVLTDKARNHLGWRPTFNVMDLYRQRHS